MKTKKQMGVEMIELAKSVRDETGEMWPQPVIIGFGVVALASSQEHKDELLRTNRNAWIFAVVANIVLVAILFFFVGL